MSGNYDHPPASSRRPSRPGNVRLPSPNSMADPPGRDTSRDRHQTFAVRFPQTQQLIDHWRSSNPEAPERESSSDEDYGTLVSELQSNPGTVQLLDNFVNSQPGTPRYNQSAARYPGVSYLRNLISSENNRPSPSSEDVRRAWDTLHREVEVRHNEARNQDQTRDRFNFEQARAAVDRQIQRLQRLRSDAQESRSVEPRPPTNRTVRRRSFRPALRDTLPRPALMPQRSPSGRGRVKRRKLDADDHREGTGGFHYGHNGQVVPGPLKMEIASCDGGMFDFEGDGTSPECVLRNDSSRYRSLSDRCNLILRHRGEAPFCLQKLVIKAPGVGFDASIQEGMVFVSMASDELLHRTARYQIQYSHSRHRRRLARRSNVTPSMEYLNGFRPPLRSLQRTVLMSPDSQVTRDAGIENGETNDTHAEFRVTIDDKETGDENVFLDSVDDDIPTISEIERALEEDFLSDSDDDIITDDDDDEDEDSATNAFSSRRRQGMRRQFESNPRRGYSDPAQRRRQYPSLIDPLPQSSSAPSNAAVLTPHARFFIERDKGMVSIKFDPPPSGRFILVKLWSPRSDINIDIQSIIAHGFAGPRFFPSGGLPRLGVSCFNGSFDKGLITRNQSKDSSSDSSELPQSSSSVEFILFPSLPACSNFEASGQHPFQRLLSCSPYACFGWVYTSSPISRSPQAFAFHCIKMPDAPTEQPFRLLDLPPELRLMIYERILLYRIPKVVDHSDPFHAGNFWTVGQLGSPAIRATCRQVECGSSTFAQWAPAGTNQLHTQHVMPRVGEAILLLAQTPHQGLA
ncbi:hypothetical protein N7470_000771 [Penicillium chermesinum]|nr:hypothetical protein N7470_000771 [Penicillium chermesinum]